MGPFEEEEEGTGIASDVVKVEGAEFGHPRSPDLRNDTGTAISPISGQQNKVTHTAASCSGCRLGESAMYASRTIRHFFPDNILDYLLVPSPRMNIQMVF